jgi:uncharacterized HAD superfamily protein
MKIGIDLDDVVFESMNEFLRIVQEEYGVSFEFEKIESYSLHDVFNLTREDIKKIVKKVDWINLPLFENSKECILTLSRNHYIYFITSRTFEDGTEESLVKHFSEINFKLFFSSNHHAGTSGKDKGEIGREIGIDFMIEDNSKHALDCAEKGIKTFLLEKPWNKNLGKHRNILRVKNWKEILEEMENDNKT